MTSSVYELQEVFHLTASHECSRLRIAGRSCLLPSHLSRPDIPYFTHDWRNRGIISNTSLSSSMRCVINLCHFSAVSLCSSGQWKQSAQRTAERLPALSSLQLGFEGLHSQSQVPTSVHHTSRAGPARASSRWRLDRVSVQPLYIWARAAGQNPVGWKCCIHGAKRCYAAVRGAGPGASRRDPEGSVWQQLELLAAQAGVCGCSGLFDWEEALVVPGALHPSGYRWHLCRKGGHPHESAGCEGEFLWFQKNKKRFLWRLLIYLSANFPLE